MQDVIETRALYDYGGRAENYLNDWARRTGNVDTIAEYEVRVLTDHTGALWGHVVKKRDPDAAPAADAPADPDPLFTEEDFETAAEEAATKKKRK